VTVCVPGRKPKRPKHKAQFDLAVDVAKVA
jgi:hypothetical protein